MTRYSKLLVGGNWHDGIDERPVIDKYTRDVVATVAIADKALIDKAVHEAHRAFSQERISPYRRYEILTRTAELLLQRRASVLDTMVAETGFTHADNVGDFNRCIQTLRTSAEEAKRIAGEVVPIDGAPGHDGELAFTIRVPLGVVCAITPFNSPLNTVAHKVAPALAAGNSVVLKPSSYTPLSAQILCEALLEAGLPEGWINLVHGDGGTVGQWLLENERIRYFAFTGGEGAGRAIQAGAGLRRTQMELGNISATIVCEDANLDVAATKCAGTAFRKAGQVCTSLQRIFVQRPVVEELTERLVRLACRMTFGDPRHLDTVVGPMIDPKEAERAANWLDEAIDQGAEIMVGGERDGPVMSPTVLTGATPTMKVVSQEIFAPVVSVIPFDHVQEAIDAVNETPYGLSAGIFTSNIDIAFRAARAIEVGLFNINQTSSNRADPMPYGGCKDSGFGREGPLYAIHDMTDERLITITPVNQ